MALGSNLGDKEENINKAIEHIRDLSSTTLIKTSPLYKTSPVGNVDQDWFINAVIKVRTQLSPISLLETLLTIENKLGRKREEKWGPRSIDLDILFYDDLIINEKDLLIPHEYLHERRFVLAPLSDIEPELLHPVLKMRISKLLDKLDSDEQLERLVSRSA
ncbi:2-amino-4-hydroxy-6-hydroxymethyldihydropteridine diphosphokinase [Thermodesulfobacteriota bacterium]